MQDISSASSLRIRRASDQRVCLRLDWHASFVSHYIRLDYFRRYFAALLLILIFLPLIFFALFPKLRARAKKSVTKAIELLERVLQHAGASHSRTDPLMRCVKHVRAVLHTSAYVSIRRTDPLLRRPARASGPHAV